MVENIWIEFVIKDIAILDLKSIFSNVNGLNIEWHIYNVYDQGNDVIPNYKICNKALEFYYSIHEFDIDRYAQNSILYIRYKNEETNSFLNSFAIEPIQKGIYRLRFESQEPDLDLTKFHFYEQFFYDLYRSLPGQVSYKSFVNLYESSRKFSRENDLTKYKYINAAFLDTTFFYRVVTPASVYKEWHTKEQLFNAPFYSIKEGDNEELEIIASEEPFNKNSQKSIEQHRAMRKYLSENNHYPKRK